MPGSGRETQALQFSRAMKKYSPTPIKKNWLLAFFRRYLAIHLSVILLGLGTGIGRAENNKSNFNTPPAHMLRFDKVPTPDFSLAAEPEQNSFSLAIQAHATL